MLIFGITGGSGAGKTTVSDMFRTLGVYVADADLAAREVVKKGMPALAEITEYFGSDVLLGDGSLDRRKLAGIVFSDKASLKKLNEITNKYIKMYIEQQLSHADCEIAAIDGAVIIGSSVEPLCSYITAVTADRETRILRIMKRDSISRADAEKRIDAQQSDDFYIAHSDFVIQNNDITTLRTQAENILNQIRKKESGI